MIVCWFYKKIAAHHLDELPAKARAHIETCLNCRRHYESEADVARRLAAGAEAERLPASPFLHGRIMASLDRSPGMTGDNGKVGRPGWAVALGAMCLLLLGVFVIWHQPSPQSPGIHRTVGASSTTAPPLTVRLPPVPQLREWTEKLDEPLETEMQLVVSDARTAMNCLVESLLPDTVREVLFEPAEN